MIELVAERGFDAITVREFAGRAGVSTRTFYQCYSGKEDCFLRVHELVARRLLGDLSSARADNAGRCCGLERTIAALFKGMDDDPAAARLLLVDSQTAGPRAGAQARRVLRSIERGIEQNLTRADEGSQSPLVGEALTAGLLGLAASSLLGEPESPLGGLARGLSDWARVIDDIRPLGGLEGLSVTTDARPPIPSSEVSGVRRGDVDGDASLLLSSAAKLVASSDHEPSSTKALLRAAGVSRRSFQERFASLDDCVLTAIRLRGESAIAGAELAGRGTSDPAARAVRAVTSLCSEVATDPELASICFGRRAFERPEKMRCQDRLRKQFSDVVSVAIGVDSPSVNLQIDASVAAAWGMLHGRVLRGRASTVSHLAPFLACMVLAPSVGPRAAIEVVQREYAAAGPELSVTARSSTRTLST